MALDKKSSVQSVLRSLNFFVAFILTAGSAFTETDSYYPPQEISALQQFQEKNENLQLIDEQLEITLLDVPHDFDMYRFEGRYVIKNNGDDCRQTVGITSRRFGGGHQPDEACIPLEMEFFINGGKTDFNAVFEPDKPHVIQIREDKYIITVDVEFKSGGQTTLQIKYKNYNQGYHSGPDFVECPSSDFSLSSRNHPFTLSINNRSNDGIWISDVMFKEGLMFNSLMRESGGPGTDFFTFSILNEQDVKFDFFGSWRDNITDSWLHNDYGLLLIYVARLDFYFGRGRFEDGSRDIYWGDPQPEEDPKTNMSLDRISPFELGLLTKNQLRVFRNVYYAQYGYDFKDQYLRDVFTHKYKLLNGLFCLKSDHFSDDLLTDIERENIQTILNLEYLKK
jgi:hypothetical protein